MAVSAIEAIQGKRHKAPIEHKSGSIASPDAWIQELFGADPTISGQNITPETAMRATPVLAAVSLISDAVGTLPAKVFERLGDGGKKPAHFHPAYRLVHDDANDFTSATAFRSILTADSLLHGNGYAFANRIEGRVIELIRLDPGAVSIEFNAAGEPVFRVREAHGDRLLSFMDVLHVPSPAASADGVAGVSPIRMAREAIALCLTLESYAGRLFSNGARPSGLLALKGVQSPEALAKARAAWEATHGGAERAGRTAVLPGDATFTPLSLTSVDAQFAELRQAQVNEIARAFRVPPVFLADYSRATWSNSEEMGRQFLQFTLLPWLRAWEGAYRRVLIAPEDRDTFEVAFVVDDLLRGDTKARAESYAKLRAAGVVTANEVRRWENLPALPDGDVLANPFTTSGSPREAQPHE